MDECNHTRMESALRGDECAECLREKAHDKIKAIFHKCWGEAHDSPDYNKRNWMELQSALQERGIAV